MNKAPVRFELLVNGESIVVAGINEYGVLSGIVSWFRRFPGNITPELQASKGFSESDFLTEVCEVTITGLDATNDTHSEWAKHALKPGDEVTFRILPLGVYDKPESFG